MLRGRTVAGPFDRLRDRMGAGPFDKLRGRMVLRGRMGGGVRGCGRCCGWRSRLHGASGPA